MPPVSSKPVCSDIYYMELSAAMQLIEKGIDLSLPGQQWADLGAGNGLFTTALSILLKNGGTIYAVDKNGAALKTIQSPNPAVNLIAIKKDFADTGFDQHSLDGVLMANALHYVKEQVSFLQQLQLLLKKEGRIILVEYDTDRGNTWVPYPISFSRLQQFTTQLKSSKVTKLAEQPSVYQRAGMYAALIQEA